MRFNLFLSQPSWWALVAEIFMSRELAWSLENFFAQKPQSRRLRIEFFSFQRKQKYSRKKGAEVVAKARPTINQTVAFEAVKFVVFFCLR